MADWLQSKETCPDCNSIYTPGKVLNTYVRKQLNAFEFNCD